MKRSLPVFGAAIALVFSASPAAAQRTGFAVNRFEPAERGSQFFVNDTLDLRGGARPALGATLDYSYKPLVVYAPNGDERSSIVRHQLLTDLGGSVVLFDRLRLGLELPLALYQDGERAVVNVHGANEEFKPADKAAFGDVRLAADVRIIGAYNDAFSLAAGVRAWLPTGQRSQFTGDGSARVGPQALAAGTVGVFVYSARLGLVYRARDDGYAGSPLGSELLGAAAAGIKVLDDKLVVGPEVYASSVFTDSKSFFKTRGTPAEWLFGLHYDVVQDVRLGAGVGGGLTRGFGAPQLRGLFSVEWAPAYAKPDRDKDGIIDVEDACPDTPGVRDPDPKKNGCPPAPPPDADGDGIIDSQDACPNDPGPRTDDPATNGCPDRDKDGIIDKLDACPEVPGVKDPDPKKNGCPPDKDGDGIPDAEDACPLVPGVRDPDPKKNGCPPDRDGDGIIDSEDACPDVPGPRDPDPKKNGCPLVQVTEKEIRIIEQVKFKFDSAEILPESDRILDAVKGVLEAHSEIKKLRVEGHTDNVGKAPYNKTLSQKRADAVMAWLTKHGIDKKRMASHGYGQEEPLETNETETGRAANRRVAFTILERDGAASPPTSGAPPAKAEKKEKK